jgi:hypothetical protein
MVKLIFIANNLFIISFFEKADALGFYLFNSIAKLEGKVLLVNQRMLLFSKIRNTLPSPCSPLVWTHDLRGIWKPFF